ncbi:MAG: hypothetical protein IJU70_04700 [Lentisphaeria bacterium]|nr:hypothetical protein [Lentisphaeria bacterium]
MTRFIRPAAFLLFLAVAGGCVSTPPAPIRPGVPPLRRAEKQLIDSRCKKLRSVLAPLSVRGIGLHPRAFETGYAPEDICRFITDCGFNRVYFHISSETELDERLTGFLVAAEKARLVTEIVLRHSHFHPRSRGNRVLRSLRPDFPDVPEMVRRVVEYDRKLPPEAGRLDGITVWVEPHLYTNANPGTKQIFSWSEKAFGPGLDNDLLVLASLDMLRRIDPGDLPLTIAVPDFYQELVSERKITKGTVLDFMATRRKAPPVMLISSARKPSQIVEGTLSELEATGKQHQVLLGIELAGHVSDSGAKLRKRDWNDFIRIMEYVVREHRRHPEFRGLMITPLVVLEHIITEHD